jgi:hypothetical protein
MNWRMPASVARNRTARQRKALFARAMARMFGSIAIIAAGRVLIGAEVVAPAQPVVVDAGDIGLAGVDAWWYPAWVPRSCRLPFASAPPGSSAVIVACALREFARCRRCCQSRGRSSLLTVRQAAISAALSGGDRARGTRGQEGVAGRGQQPHPGRREPGRHAQGQRPVPAQQQRFAGGQAARRAAGQLRRAQEFGAVVHGDRRTQPGGLTVQRGQVPTRPAAAANALGGWARAMAPASGRAR